MATRSRYCEVDSIRGEHLLPVIAGDELLSYWTWERDANNPCVIQWIPMIGLLVEHPGLNEQYAVITWVVSGFIEVDILLDRGNDTFSFINKQKAVPSPEGMEAF